MENITEYQGKKYREVERVAKVGELVKIVNAQLVPTTNGISDYRNGDILKVIWVYDEGTGQVYYFDAPEENNRRKTVLSSEYVVLEPIEQEFTLADLKPCMVVEIRDGRLALVVERKDGLALSELTDLSIGLIGLKRFSENLKVGTVKKSDYDIMKIYDFSDSCVINSIQNRELIWQRTEKSPAQIELEKLEQEQRELAEKRKQIADKMEEVRKWLK